MEGRMKKNEFSTLNFSYQRTNFFEVSQLSTQSGFTLIELLTSITVMAIIATFSIASFSSYNNSQGLQTTTADIVNTLALAKSRAVSQIIDSQCTNKSLAGYQV